MDSYASARMSDSPNHELDLCFAEACLAGNESDLRKLSDLLDQPVHNYLRSTGGRESETAEILANLHTELVCPADGRRPLLASYLGEGSVVTWLNRVALNRLISRRRAVIRDRDRFDGETDLTQVPAPTHEGGREPIAELLARAIETAFAQCEPEHFVMLHLIHSNRLTQEEVAVMFSCSIATVSRQTSEARAQIRKAIEAQIMEQDPWLELKWEDFIELCATTPLHCLGS
jgi:RNA polymerase sigma factor (sigma-70 family)